MPKQSIYINKSPQEVYDFLATQLANTYKVSKSHLLNAKYSRPLNRGKRSVILNQTITEVVVNQLIRFESRFGIDSSITEYRIEPMDEGSILHYSEEGTSQKFSRRLNYKFFSLPLIRKYSERRLFAMIQQIKQQLEKENDQ